MSDIILGNKDTKLRNTQPCPGELIVLWGRQTHHQLTSIQEGVMCEALWSTEQLEFWEKRGSLR